MVGRGNSFNLVAATKELNTPELLKMLMLLLLSRIFKYIFRGRFSVFIALYGYFIIRLSLVSMIK